MSVGRGDARTDRENGGACSDAAAIPTVKPDNPADTATAAAKPVKFTATLGRGASTRTDTAGSTGTARPTRSARSTGSAGPNRPPDDVHAVSAHPVIVAGIRIDRPRHRGSPRASPDIALGADG